MFLVLLIILVRYLLVLTVHEKQDHGHVPDPSRFEDASHAFPRFISAAMRGNLKQKAAEQFNIA